MVTKRIIQSYHVNPKRDKQYDDALHQHLRATWKLPGRTHTQIARALDLGDPSKDKAFGYAIMYALHEFAESDDETICWYPNLRLKEADLQKKREKSKYNDYGLKLYKHAPDRKIIDRDPSRSDEIVRLLILSYIKALGPKSGNAILHAMQMALGHIANSVVEKRLTALTKGGEITAQQVNRKLIRYDIGR